MSDYKPGVPFVFNKDKSYGRLGKHSFQFEKDDTLTIDRICNNGRGLFWTGIKDVGFLEISFDDIELECVR